MVEHEQLLWTLTSAQRPKARSTPAGKYDKVYVIFFR